MTSLLESGDFYFSYQAVRFPSILYCSDSSFTLYQISFLDLSIDRILLESELSFRGFLIPVRFPDPLITTCSLLLCTFLSSKSHRTLRTPSSARARPCSAPRTFPTTRRFFSQLLSTFTSFFSSSIPLFLSFPPPFLSLQNSSCFLPLLSPSESIGVDDYPDPLLSPL